MSNTTSIIDAPRIALLGSSTLQHVPELLTPRCARHGLRPRWHVAPYQQYQQEALDASSGLYEFDPEVTIVAIEANWLLRDHYDRPYGLSAAGRRQLARRAARELIALVDALLKHSRGLVVLHNLEVPTYSPLGWLEPKQPFGWQETVRTINRTLARYAARQSRVFLLDYDGVLSRCGKDRAHDARLGYLADMPVRATIWQQLGDEYARLLLARAGRTIKCIVVDLDNTLWGGVVGEDGLADLELGDTPLGRAYVAFQRQLLALADRGVLLAINSHNNAEDALRVIREHPHMILREQHFAVMAINWESKADNLRALAAELNLGLEHFLYIDDDQAQRWLVQQQLPQVRVLDLPPDPAAYVEALQRVIGLDVLELTDEDRRRGVLYSEERVRRAFQRQTPSVESFLVQLQITVRLRAADTFAWPRLAQLTQRTNQFHATADRFIAAELAAWSGMPERECYAIEVADRFGDQGISGALGVQRAGDAWHIELLLLSCRVLGKGVEQAVLGALICRARAAGVQVLTCAFVPTDKNGPVKRFLETAGFTPDVVNGPRQRWRLAVAHAAEAPSFIAVSVA